MPNSFLGLSDTSGQGNFLTNLGQLLLLMQGASQNQPLQTLGALNQMQYINAKLTEYQREQAAAQQKARLTQQLGAMLGGDLGPGQLGPPTPFDPNAFAAVGTQISSEYGKMGFDPNLIAQMRQAGRLPSQASVDVGYLGEIGAPPGGYLSTMSLKPGAPEVSFRSPTSPTEHRALGLSQQGLRGQALIEASKEADVSLPTIKDMRDNFVALQTRRQGIADLRGGKKENPLIAVMANPEQKKALEAMLVASPNPKQDLALMLQDFMLSEQMQVVENKLADMEKRERQIVAPEYEPFKANAEEKAQKLRVAFHAAYDRDPTKEELRMLFIADLLETSGASKWLTRE